MEDVETALKIGLDNLKKYCLSYKKEGKGKCHYWINLDVVSLIQKSDDTS